MKGKNFIIDLVVYPYDIMFSIGQTDYAFELALSTMVNEVDLRDILRDPIISLSPETRGRTFHHHEGGQTVIRLPSIPKTPTEIGTLSHEIFHAVSFIFRRIGMKASSNSEEAYAYAIGYVTEQFWTKLNA